MNISLFPIRYKDSIDRVFHALYVSTVLTLYGRCTEPTPWVVRVVTRGLSFRLDVLDDFKVYEERYGSD